MNDAEQEMKKAEGKEGLVNKGLSLSSFPVNPPVTEPTAIKLAWLINIRWLAIAAQAVTVVVAVALLPASFPVWVLFFIIALTALGNALAMAFKDGLRSEWLLRSLLLYDVLALTGLLFFSGGSENPFRFLYVIHVALAALMLKSLWKWVVVALCSLCFVGLYCFHYSFFSQGETEFITRPLEIWGEWLAFGVAMIFIAYSVFHLSTKLLKHEALVREMKEREWKNSKLVSLATLAGGAAHELATPLSTIAIAAKELERRLKKLPREYEALLLDAQLIRQEVGTCRDILHQMSGTCGELMGEKEERFALLAFISSLRPTFAGSVQWHLPEEEVVLCLPRRCLNFTLNTLVQNALLAGGQEPPAVWFSRHQDSLLVEVKDFGVGMSPQTLERLGEPFFTTREPGEGMGLGVYLAQQFAESMGGSLEFHSELGVGTTAYLRLVLPS